MRNIISRLWLRRLFRGFMWLFLALFVVLIVARQYIGWSGTRRWVAVQQMLAREGESIDFRKAAPDPVPDDQNFCAIPALKDISLIPPDADEKSEQGRKRARLINAALPTKSNVSQPKLSQGVLYGEAADMQVWADWLHTDVSPPTSGDPVRDVVAALSRNDALVSELALGLSRPESQWTPAWKTRELPENLFTIGVPHLLVAQKLTLMLGLRSIAAARAGDTAAGCQSLLIALRLDQAAANEPLVIGTLVASGCSMVISNAVWELCDSHSGTEEDFQGLQEELARLDFRKAYLYAERGELAGGVNTSAYLKRERSFGPLMTVDPMHGTDAPNVSAQYTLHLVPDGWFDGNAATLAQWHFDYYIKPLRDAGFKQLLAKQAELGVILAGHKSRIHDHPDEFLAMLAMPALHIVAYRIAYAQSILNEAIAACALERYRIKHNTYPDTLEAADRPGEKAIPLDIISGKPMGYRKTPNGKYALWCVGFNGKDDGGKRGLDEKNPQSNAFSRPDYVGDWVWDFAAK